MSRSLVHFLVSAAQLRPAFCVLAERCSGLRDSDWLQYARRTVLWLLEGALLAANLRGLRRALAIVRLASMNLTLEPSTVSPSQPR